MTDNKLFSPLQVKGHTFKNRIGVAPMTRTSAPADSIPRSDVLEFLVRRAENDAAVVYTEAIVTDYESAQGYPRQSRLLTQRQVDAWAAVGERVRKHGAVFIAQIFHCGRIAWPEINPAGRIIAPSEVAPRQDNPLTGAPYPVPDAASRFDIDHVINGFVESAKGAVAAGFDGVEIHGAHGYLINQFLSEYSNHRTDDYGGNPEKRFRFAREVIEAVRRVVPDDRLLTFRISNWAIADMEVSLFKDAAEYQTIIGFLDKTPIDILSVSTYDYSETAFETEKTMARLTKEATDLPLINCGRIYDRNTADDALKDADFVLSGKSMLLNPHFVQDLHAGKTLTPYSSKDADIAYTDTPLP
jgi:2,4-dienoyl-CoA reductase-like NADH-dependent reductase (Old Yellow Enzyme family)